MSDWRNEEPGPEQSFPEPPPAWPPSGQPQPPPGYPGYSYGPGTQSRHGPKTDSGATTALVLGILSFFCCLFGFAAIYEGHEARQRIIGAPHELKGEGLAIAGMTLGVISLALSLVATILFVVV